MTRPRDLAGQMVLTVAPLRWANVAGLLCVLISLPGGRVADSGWATTRVPLARVLAGPLLF